METLAKRKAGAAEIKINFQQLSTIL